MANEFVVKNGLVSPNVQLQGSTSGAVTLTAPAVAGSTSITLPATAGTLVTTGDTGSVTNTMLAGSITNAKLVNSSLTVGTTSISLGGSSTTLAGLTSVTSNSFVGALTGNASTASALQTARTISLTGDVAGSVSFDGSGNASITTTIQADSVALGTDTTGNYMVNVSAGTGVSVSHTQGEGSTATVSIGQAVGTTDNVTFNNVTVSGTLTSDDITSTNISIAGDATITGNLTVSGTTTTVNSTTIALADVNIELARNATTAAQANGAGITVTGPTTAATFTYTSADDRWNLNKNLNITRVYGTATNVSSSHSAGSYLTGSAFDGSSAVSWAVDATPSNTASKVVARDASGNFSASTITATLSGNASTASSWQTARTLSYTGDATGSLSVDGSTNVSTALTLSATGVTAGTYNNVTVDTKGRVTSGSNVAYLTSESDTLATVTARGASTSTASTFSGGLTASAGLTVSGSNTSSSPIIPISVTGSGAWQRGVRMLNSGMAAGDSLMYSVGQADSNKNMGQFYFYYSGASSTSNRLSMGLHSVDDVFNIFGSGNIMIGTTTDNGYKLNVNGTFNATSTITQNGVPVLTSESDTLASVTGRGASTSTNISLTGGSLTISGSNGANLYLSADNVFRWIAGTTGYGVGSGFGLYSDTLGAYFTSLSTSGNWYFGTNTHNSSYRVSVSGTGYATNDFRAPIFYDSDDTNYYLDPNAGGTSLNVAGNIISGNGGSDTGLRINHGGGSGDYGRIRFYQAGSNNQTIHVFPTTWQGGTLAGHSAGAINLTGANGVTFGDWNNIDAYIGKSGNLWVRTKIGIGVDASAKLHVQVAAPSGVQAVNSAASVVIDNTGNNFIQFRNSADNNSYQGLLFSDNNQGGYVVFGNAGGAGDMLRLGGYNSISFDVGTDDSTSSVALRTQRGYIDSSSNLFAFGSMRSPIFYDYNDTTYYADLNSTGWGVYSAGGGRFRNIQISSSTYTDTIQNVTSGGWLWLQYGHNGNIGLAYGGGVVGVGAITPSSGDKMEIAGNLRVHTGNNWDAVQIRADGANGYIQGLGDETGLHVRSEYGNIYIADNRGDVRMPMFYDVNDTGYYCDPNSTSNFANLTLGGRNMRSFEANSFVEFYVEGDANTYYPVRFDVSAWMHWGRWSISRGYGDTAPWDPIGTGAHHGGLTLTWEWSGDGAWGGNDHNVRVVEWTEQYTTVVGGMALSVNGMIVWLRGGHAYYRFHGPGGMTNSATPYYSTYTASNGTTYPVRSNASSAAGEINYRYPVRGTGYLYEQDHWILHEDEWQNGKYFSSGGIIYANSSHRAPIFYDYDDTSYYIDPNNGGFYLKGGSSNRVTYSTNDSGFRVYNAEGNGVSDVRLGAAWGLPGVYSSSYLMLGSENYIEFRTQNNQRGYIDNSANLFAYGSMRSPIFYDNDDTGYYIDPNSTGTSYRGRGEILLGTNTSGRYLRLGGNGGATDEATVSASNGNLHIDSKAGYGVYLNHYSSGDIITNNGGGIFYNYTSVRSPIFYDYNDTGYYVDPSSTSYLRKTNFYVQNDNTCSFTNNDLGAAYFNDRGGRILTSNGSNWLADGRDVPLTISGTWTHTNRGLLGIALHNESNTSGHYSPAIVFSSLSDSSGYNSGYAFIMGKKTGQNAGVDSNWNKGELHFYAVGDSYIADTPSMRLWNNGDMETPNSVRSAIFYDYNDTAYYVDPNSSSKVNTLRTVTRLDTPRINFVDSSGSQESDPYCFRWVGESDGGSGLSWLELQMNDDDNEEFRIYGYSCSGYGCGQISSNLYHRFKATGYAWHAGNLETGGSITASGNVTAYSDVNLKKDITTIENPLDKVMQLRGVNYTKIADESKSLGVIAQEVEKIIPEVVMTNDEGIKSVAYGNMVGLLIEAIKEQQKQIEELKGIINEIRR